jgi:hypothetical protein
LDDLAPLRQATDAAQAEPAHLYKPSVGYRLRNNVNLDTPFPPEVPHAENPSPGAIIYYSLSSAPTGYISVEIVDSSGRVVRHYSSAPIKPYDDPATAIPDFWRAARLPLPTELGLNRINWDVRYDDPPAYVHDPQDTMQANPGITPNETQGPLALPGDYTVRLIVDGRTYTQPLRIVNDPRSPASLSAVRSEEELLLGCYDGARTAYDGVQQVADLRAKVAAVIAGKPADAVVKAAKDYDDKLAKVGGEIFRGRPIFGPPPPTSFANMVPFLLYQMSSWDDGDVAPTEEMRCEYGYDWAQLHLVCEQWRALSGKGLADFNAVLVKNGLQALTVVMTPVQEPASPPARYLPPKAAPQAKPTLTQTKP